MYTKREFFKGKTGGSHVYFTYSYCLTLPPFSQEPIEVLQPRQTVFLPYLLFGNPSSHWFFQCWLKGAGEEQNKKDLKKSQQMALESNGDGRKIPLTHSKAVWARLGSEDTWQAKKEAAAARGGVSMHSVVFCFLPNRKAGQPFSPPSPVSTPAPFIYFMSLQSIFNLLVQSFYTSSQGHLGCWC